VCDPNFNYVPLVHHVYLAKLIRKKISLYNPYILIELNANLNFFSPARVQEIQLILYLRALLVEIFMPRVKIYLAKSF
jgi:hypothetical protein